MSNDLNLPQMDNNSKLPGNIIINTAAISKPCILLIGPRSVGKTVTLIRLSKFLMSGADYTVSPNRSFRSGDEYQSTCDKFIKMVQSVGEVPDPTTGPDFLLADIKYEGKTIFHVLEAPGEHYFDETEPGKNWFYPYLTDIFNKRVKKIFVFFFVEGFLDSDKMQIAYSNRLKQIIAFLKSKTDDRIIFCLNKVDELGIEKDGVIDHNYVKDTILDNDNYNSLKNKIKGHKKLEPVRFVPNSNGYFTPAGDGSDVYTLSPDEYPQLLWTAINKKKAWSILGFRIS